MLIGLASGYDRTRLRELGAGALLHDVGKVKIPTEILLQHHERLDGSGYPRRLRGEKILEIGRIVAVADVLCAMTTDRVYRRKVLPREAVRYLKAAADKFDQRFVRRLALRVAAFPNGTFLRLSTGQLAVVVRQDPRNTERPVVRLLADAGNRPIEPVEVALAEASDLGVALVLDDIPEDVRRALSARGGAE
ncbi:MAG: hypothetical protein H5U04_03530 [Firmicutes bacterium]|nr:hypothetical protein [Bacillota bacterium]